MLPRIREGLSQGISGPSAVGNPRIVAVGGGTGLPVVLRGLRDALRTNSAVTSPEVWRDRLTAVVTVADDGGSSGRLRQDYGVLPPGDIRNCLLALSEDDGPLAALFAYRFNGKGEVTGHNLGNLILTALSHIESRFDRAVERAGNILAVCGRVLPATSVAIGLVAEFDDGSCVEGESRIAGVHRPIRRVRLQPEQPPAHPEALEAVAAADCVVIGPGSLYTSLIPALLVEGMARALAHSRARVMLVMNLMTEPGETDDLTAQDHLRILRAHVPQIVIHDVILNDASLAEPLRHRYGLEGARPLPLDTGTFEALGYGVWLGDLLAPGDQVRHDPDKLARAILEVAGRPRSRTV